MKLLILVFVCFQATFSSFEARVLTCNSSATTSPVAFYCLPVDNSSSNSCAQCAAGVKYFCPTSPLVGTGSWQKGVKVLDNCNSIARLTAIGTFNSANRYEGHAAVFIRCVNGNQIEVFDQYVGKKWSTRTLWNTAGSVSNNPSAFYVINV